MIRNLSLLLGPLLLSVAQCLSPAPSRCVLGGYCKNQCMTDVENVLPVFPPGSPQIACDPLPEARCYTADKCRLASDGRCYWILDYEVQLCINQVYQSQWDYSNCRPPYFQVPTCGQYWGQGGKPPCGGEWYGGGVPVTPVVTTPSVAIPTPEPTGNGQNKIASQSQVLPTQKASINSSGFRPLFTYEALISLVLLLLLVNL